MAPRCETWTWLFLASMLVSVPVSSAESTPDDPVGAWLKHVRRCVRNVFSIRAEFAQETRYKREHPTSAVLRGVAEIRRGGLYRLTYTSPQKLVLVSDGRNIWAFDKAAKTVYTSTADKEIFDEAFGLLAGDPSETRFAMRHLGGALLPGQGRAVIELKPLNRDALVASVVLTLESQCPCIRRLLVVDHAGSLIRITLEHIETNVGLGKRRFVFKPPKGARIVTP